MFLLMTLMGISFAMVIGQEFEEPPLCGKSLINNFKIKRHKKNDVHFESTADEDEETVTIPLNVIPYIASVQRFDFTLDKDVDIFDKRVTGAFVGTILTPTAVLVACRCVAKHLGPVGDDQSFLDPRQFGVMAGTPWDYSPVDGAVGQIRFANRIVIHPKCDLGTSFFLWDMAVMVVEMPFIFIENTVGAAPIPRTSSELAHFLGLAPTQEMSYFTAGWGWAFNSYKPHHLELKLHPLFVRDWENCTKLSSAGHLKANLTRMYVCVETAASYLRLRRTGDVGSPLLGFLDVKNDTNAIQYVVLGIKSNEDAATPDGFSLFTGLEIGLDWLWDIKKNPPKVMSAASSANLNSIINITLFMVWNLFMDSHS